jgi:hypothetical protein
MGDLLFGTSSWSERTWEGVFCPSGIRPADHRGAGMIVIEPADREPPCVA